MDEATQRAISSNKKKRGVVRASVTRLHTRVGELEGSSDNPDIVDQARCLTARLQTLAQEFKVHHYTLIDLIEDEGDLVKEQDALDNFDDDISQLVTRFERLASREPSTSSCLSEVTTKRLKHRGDCLLFPIMSALSCLKRTMFVSFNSMRNVSLI